MTGPDARTKAPALERVPSSALRLSFGAALWASIVAGIGGCGTELIGAVDSSPPTACGGSLGAEPRVLASGLSKGPLFVAGEQLIYVEHEVGRVLRIDRCSGDVELLGEMGPVSSTAVSGDGVYAVEMPASAGPARLWRVPLTGEEMGVVAEVPSGARIIGHSSGVYVKSGAGVDSDDVGIFKLDESTASLSLVGVIEVWAPMSSVWLIGASDAGVYVVEFYDCGCNPTLELVPFDGSKVHSVKSSEGALSLAAVGSSMFVAADLGSVGFGSVLLDIVRLPLEGGEPEVILAETEEHTYDVRVIAANESAVCWAGYAAAPRCLRLANGSPVRVLGEEGEREAVEPIVMASDAVYWIRRAGEGEGLELVGAAP